MATLQEEMARFMSVRFGADVKDAFISCIQKIHAENLDVAALEQTMETVAEEVSQNKQDILDAVQEAEDALCAGR